MTLPDPFASPSKFLLLNFPFSPRSSDQLGEAANALPVIEKEKHTMAMVIFAAIEDEPIERFELAEAALVKTLIASLAGRHPDIAEMLVFKEDDDEPLGHDHPLKGHDKAIFHLHRCRQIKVAVNYKAETFNHKFAPGTTIKRVTKWATKKAGLDDAEAQEHVLQISGSRTQPPLNAHLGSLKIRGCEIEFDLVRKQLVQG